MLLLNKLRGAIGERISLAVVELEAGQGQTLEAILKGKSHTSTVYDGVLMGSAPSRVAALKRMVSEQLISIRMPS